MVQVEEPAHRHIASLTTTAEQVRLGYTWTKGGWHLGERRIAPAKFEGERRLF